MRRALLITSALIVTLITGLLPTRVRAADDDHNIPGVALPSLRITSEVGGAVFDRVWSLDLSEGKVALFRLSGETGAELGLYIFNNFARSVYSATPIATSARPGASQEIAVALPAGRYFVNVNGRNTDRTYRFTLTTALYADITPPTIDARLVGGNSRFSAPLVDIEPRVVDSLSGVTHLRYGVDDSDWSSWLSYSGGVLHVPVPAAEGTYRIRIQARNGVELLSDIATLYATIDQTAPGFSVVADLSRQLTYSSSPRLIYLFDEEMDPASFTAAVILRDLSGALLPTTCTYDQLSRTAACIPAEPLTFGRTYLVDFQGARDVAGNSVVDTNPLTLSVLRRTSISLKTKAASIRSGETVGIRVAVEGIPSGTRLILEARASRDDVWAKVGAMIVNRVGEATAPISLDSYQEFRVRYLGTLERAPTESKVLAIEVAPDLRIKSPLANLTVPAPGSDLSVIGTISPSHAQVDFVVLKCRAGYQSCRVISRSAVAPDSTGLISTVWATERGFWKIRFVSPAQDGLLRAVSRTIRIAVR